MAKWKFEWSRVDAELIEVFQIACNQTNVKCKTF